MSDVVKYQIPQHDQDPPEGMVDWLAECTQEWDGDESGINIMVFGTQMSGGPGDWVVCRDGIYFITKQADMPSGAA